MLLFVAGAQVFAQTPLPNAHAHNDYEHPRPLLDALAQGFCSIEADVWLLNGALLVGHDEKDLTTERTLEALYLAPLRERITANGGQVYPDGPEVILLVDIKNRPVETYRALTALLREYEDVVTSFGETWETLRGVRVVLSGGRPVSLMLEQTTHHAAYDGRIPDLEKDYPAKFMPLVSASFATVFPKATIPLDEATRNEIRRLTDIAHAQGRKFRFWATPEDEALWAELLELGVDLINTDQLAQLAEFLNTHE